MTRAILAKVHIAKKELALSDDDYRSILGRVTGRDSSRDCTAPQLERLLDEFRRLGWKPKGGGGYGKPHVRKIYALWQDAGRSGAVDNASREALRAFVKRQTRKDAPEFCTPGDANRVTEALKAMIGRAEDRR